MNRTYTVAFLFLILSSPLVVGLGYAATERMIPSVGRGVAKIDLPGSKLRDYLQTGSSTPQAYIVGSGGGRKQSSSGSPIVAIAYVTTPGVTGNHPGLTQPANRWNDAGSASKGMVTNSIGVYNSRSQRAILTTETGSSSESGSTGGGTGPAVAGEAGVPGGPGRGEVNQTLYSLFTGFLSKQ
jgi:hypothetical protein